MTAEEFNTKYWYEHNPLNTPIWRCSEAYAEYVLEEYKKKNNVWEFPEMTDKEKKEFSERP